MSDISVSERRLSAALDRIDQMLEAGRHRPAQQPATAAEDSAAIEALLAENASLAARIAQLEAQPAPQDAPDGDAALADLRNRLTGTAEQAARLAAANDDLASANRALIEAASGQAGMDVAETVIGALEAEIEALRAARAAEIAQMGDIMAELERLLADHPEAAPSGEAGPAEIAGDGAGVPEPEADPGPQPQQSGFSGLYDQDDTARPGAGMDEGR